MRPMSTDHRDPATSAHDDHAHGAGAHDDGHDDHGHDEAPLGPIDLAAWGAGALGILIGVAVAFCFVLATAQPA